MSEKLLMKGKDVYKRQVSEPERYFSHRVMGDRRGNGAAVIVLEEERG